MAPDTPRYPLQAAGIKGSGDYQDVVSPYTGETIAAIEQADAVDSPRPSRPFAR
jgi:hypothetical protein